jgi:ABC-2 type transport system permease protein
MIDRETRILFRKEWRQLSAGTSALVTGAILPVLLLGAVPLFMSLAASSPKGHEKPIAEAMRFGLLGELHTDPRHFAGSMLPVMVALAGMILPTMMASYLLITERERRTLELLVALPVRIEQVLLAKMLATLLASVLMTLPVLLIDMVVLPARGAATFEQVIALPLLLVSALALSISVALVMSLLSKDFRTANNMAGALLVPLVFGSFVLHMLLPGGVLRPLGMSLAYAVAAVFVLRYALRTVTFERLLS